MLCENCNKREATIHYTEVVGKVRSERHLCGQCAAQLNLTGDNEKIEQNFPFVKLLTGLLASESLQNDSNDYFAGQVSCPRCHMSFREFTRTGKFGCAECYDVFGPLIDENIKKLHGDNVHCGKVYFKKKDLCPEMDTSVELQIEELLTQQREAVLLENYELAAQCRDRIRALREKSSQN